MNAQLQRAQAAYDARLPDDSPIWAESSEWANIHYCAVDDLILHGQVRFAGKLLVEADILCIKIQKAAEDALPGDHECNLGQLLVALKAGKYEEARHLADFLLGKDRIRSIASDLVNAKADEIYRLHIAAQEAA